MTVHVISNVISTTKLKRQIWAANLRLCCRVREIRDNYSVWDDISVKSKKKKNASDTKFIKVTRCNMRIM